MEDPLAPAPSAQERSAGAVTGGVTVLRRLVVWDKDGNPLVTTEQFLTKPAIHDLWMAAAAQIYVVDPHDPRDAQYAGMTCAEVQIRKSVQHAARTGEGEVVLDRLIGKPRQVSETTKLVLTYEDTLKEIARKELTKTRDPLFIDVVVER